MYLVNIVLYDFYLRYSGAKWSSNQDAHKSTLFSVEG